MALQCLSYSKVHDCRTLIQLSSLFVYCDPSKQQKVNQEFHVFSSDFESCCVEEVSTHVDLFPQKRCIS